MLSSYRNHHPHHHHNNHHHHSSSLTPSSSPPSPSHHNYHHNYHHNHNQPSQFDNSHIPSPSPSSYGTPAFYYNHSNSNASPIYNPAPVQSYNSSKRIKLEDGYGPYDQSPPLENIEIPSDFDCPPLVYATDMTVAPSSQSIQLQINLHHASQPGSPATVATTSSNPPTPLSSPSRVAVFSDNSPRDLPLYDDEGYRLPGKRPASRSYAHSANESPDSTPSHFSTSSEPLWYNPQFQNISHHSRFQSTEISPLSSPVLHRENSGHQLIPKLFRTVSDAVQDELFNPGIAPGTSHSDMDHSDSTDRNGQLPALFQQAQTQHSKDTLPIQSTFIRDHSPFRANSPFHPARTLQEAIQSPTRTSTFLNIGSSFASVRARREKEIEMEAEALRERMQNEYEEMQESPQTISPRDAYVEYHESEGEGIQGSLFASSQGEDVYSQLENSSPSACSYGTIDNTPSPSPSPIQHLMATDFVFQGNLHEQQHHSSENTYPRFTREIYDVDRSPLFRPSDTRANEGAYSCTVQGCLKRFATPSKMSKHRREAHRSSSGGCRDAPTKSLLQGPSRCARINPSTGKPCNTVFSRPYDLTRHEDTIHNVTRQKVRCELCTDEKTFSRQDALTRHKKVKHGIDKQM